MRTPRPARWRSPTPATDGQVAARVSRLLRPAPRLPVAAVALVGVVAAATVAVPAAFLAFPF